MNRAESWKVSGILAAQNCNTVANSGPDQMTIMVESSRTFLFTEYAREICGVLHKQATDYRVWDNLPDRFSAHPLTKQLLERAAKDKANQKKAVDYYHSIQLLDAKGQPMQVLPHETNGHAKISAVDAAVWN